MLAADACLDNRSGAFQTGAAINRGPDYEYVTGYRDKIIKEEKAI